METTVLETEQQPSTRQNAPDRPPIALSVVVPISERADGLAEFHRNVSEALRAVGRPHEVIYVVDGPRALVLDELRAVMAADASVQTVLLNRWFGEATALAVGLDRARADTILTLPAYPQIRFEEIPRMFEAYDQENVDLLVARRHPRIDSHFNRLQSRVFHWLTGLLTGTAYHDVSCSVRVMNRNVAAEVDLYGDLHRFFPLLAFQRGFKVLEFPAKQSPDNASQRMYSPGVYLRRVLDILTLFFIFKFTKKPLRFFGLVGSGMFGVGAAVLLYLGIYRILQFGPIANRPLLILGALLIVLGLQLFSIGLLGEIVIFTHAGNVKDYRIREIREEASKPDSGK